MVNIPLFTGFYTSKRWLLGISSINSIKHSWLIPSRPEAAFEMHFVDVDGVDTLHCHLWGSIRKDGEKPGIKRWHHQVLEAWKDEVLPDVSHQKCAKMRHNFWEEMTQATRPSLFFEDIFLEFPFLLTQIFLGKKRRLFPCISSIRYHQIRHPLLGFGWFGDV